MKKIYLLSIFLISTLLQFIIVAQELNAKFMKLHEDITVKNAQEAKSFVISNLLSEVGSIQLELTHVVNSPYSKHYTFVQTINQIPILNTQIKLNTSLNGKVTSILSSAITDKITTTVSITETPEFQSLETLFSNQISSKQWHYINGSLQLVTCIEG
ncbi:MAG: Zn-dependent metalloprotease, partial [Sphingobacteriales bacterium]